MLPEASFPRLLPENHRLASPPTLDYNCIAWAAGDTENWWQPGVHWPTAVPANEYGLGVLEEAFRAMGYEPCDDARLEAGFEKVALYGDKVLYTHAARQLPSGRWTSKLGKGEDIEHDTPDDVAGGSYGEVAMILKRPVAVSGGPIENAPPQP
jgi:hypothetical protein